MNDITLSATAPKTTHFQKFFSCNTNGQALLAVNEGIPLKDALALASCFLASAEDAANRVAEEYDNSAVYAITYLVEIAKAVVDAATASLSKEVCHV